MNHLFDDIRIRIPANKFYPPVLDSSQCLFRKHLIQTLQRCNKKIILIEAQAGQGKTVLAAQYLEEAKVSFAWYQIGPEDGDPVLFLTALLSCLMNALSGFRSPLLEEMIEKGEVSSLELPRSANILWGDLDSFLKTDFHVVFDDLHLIEGSETSVALLGYLLETAPPKLRFILAARRPVGLDMPVLKYGRQRLVVGNEDLALSESEIMDLYNDILRLPVTGKTVKELRQVTEGWVMGLILAAHAMERGGSWLSRDDGSALREVARKGQLPDYFKEEVLDQVPRALRYTLLKLACLDEIPVSLAEEFSEVPEIGTRLTELGGENFFVRRLDEGGRIFRFHHLFQEFLRGRANEELSARERRQILKKGADWYLERGRVERALEYYLKAKEYGLVEKVLAENGLDLIALNRVMTLGFIVERIDEKISDDYGWISLIKGLVYLETDPSKCLPLLQKSKRIFEKNLQRLEMLIAAIHILHFYVAIAGEFNKADPLIEQSENILSKYSDDIENNFKAKAAMYLTLAFFLIRFDFHKVDHYSKIALQISESENKDSLVACLRGIRAFSCFPDWNLFNKEIEKGYSLSFGANIGEVNKLYLRLSQINLLEMEGDFHNYKVQEHLLMENIKENLVAKSVAAPFLFVWKGDIELGIGNLREALNLIQQGLDFGHVGQSPHLRSQFLHYKAYILALSDNAEAARDAAEESLRLRDIAGGKFFVVLNQMIIGGAYAQLRDRVNAETHLKKAIEGSKEMREEYLRAGAHAHRAVHYLGGGQLAEAVEDIRECLRCMRENGYVHFFSWTPQVVQPLLGTAVKNGIEVNYARKLSRERLGLSILADGAAIPLLKINTLGGLSIAIGNGVVLKVEELTQTQRELLALLIASPGLKMCQEKIQVVLWPESSPEKARANFDNLLMRLRKTLGEAITPHSVKHYLSLKKGILCLENCLLDAGEFVRNARKGLKHARSKEFWQAGNAFNSAHNLWKGPFLPNGPGSEAVQSYRDDLERLFIESSCRWTKILSRTGRAEEAEKVLCAAVKHDPFSDELSRCLYELHVENGRPAQALLVLREYEAALQRADYSSGEIEQILAAVSASSS